MAQLVVGDAQRAVGYAQAAYSSNGNLGEELVKSHGLKLFRELSDTASGTNAYIATDPARNNIVIGFKGSDYPNNLIDIVQDWLRTNFRTQPIQYFTAKELRELSERELMELGSDIKTQLGFTEAYRKIQENLLKSTVLAIQDVGADKLKEIHVTGHSLGAALATLFILDLVDTLQDNFNSITREGMIRFHTFAGPYVGNLDFVRRINSLGHNGGLLNAIRFVDVNDLAPKGASIVNTVDGNFHPEGLIEFNRISNPIGAHSLGNYRDFINNNHTDHELDHFHVHTLTKGFGFAQSGGKGIYNKDFQIIIAEETDGILLFTRNNSISGASDEWSNIPLHLKKDYNKVHEVSMLKNDTGRLETIVQAENALYHLTINLNNGEPKIDNESQLQLPTEITNPTLVQHSDGTLELFVILKNGGIGRWTSQKDSHQWTHKEDFATQLGTIDHMTVIFSNFKTLEVLAVVGGEIVHLQNKFDPNGWQTLEKFGQDIVGKPGFIHGPYGFPSASNYEVVVAIASGGLRHYYRNNLQEVWKSNNEIFASGFGRASAVNLIYTDYNKLELVVCTDTQLAHYYRNFTGWVLSAVFAYNA